MEASNRNMRKLVVYKTGVDAQLAAHYETCIQEMKKEKKKGRIVTEEVLDTEMASSVSKKEWQLMNYLDTKMAN